MAATHPVKRVNPNRIASNEETVISKIHQNERELTAQMVYQIDPVLQIQGNDNFTVASTLQETVQ